MTALITGITGQTGSFLAELLLRKGYIVHGLIRKSSTFSTERIEHLMSRGLHLHYGDVEDTAALIGLLSRVDPTEVYNLAAQSHVHVSFKLPMATSRVTGLGALSVLEALRISGCTARFYQASSSELFGDAPAPQDETTPIQPRSPYAVAKAYAYWMTRVYREAYGMHAVNGILFNHESERRSPTFVTRKITRTVARIHHGLETTLRLGNMNAVRDWGFAGDYAEGIYRMMQHPIANDWVLATGTENTVANFLDETLYALGLQHEDDRDSWKRQHLRHDASYERPLEVPVLRGNAERARVHLGWRPSLTFEELVQRMLDHDLAQAEREAP